MAGCVLVLTGALYVNFIHTTFLLFLWDNRLTGGFKLYDGFDTGFNRRSRCLKSSEFL